MRTFNEDAAEYTRAMRAFGHELAKALRLYALLDALTAALNWIVRRLAA